MKQQKTKRQRPLRRVVFVRGDRITSQVFLRKRTYAVFALVLATVFGWLFLTTFYVFFKDDLLQAAVHERRVLTQRYEAELALLRSQMSDTHLQHRSDFANYTQALDSLMSRQAVLSARHEAITKLMEKAMEGDLMPAEAQAANRTRPAPNPSSYGKPRVDASGGPFIPLTASSEAVALDEHVAEARRALERQNIPVALEAFRTALREQEEDQFASLDVLQGLALDEAETYQAVFSTTGLKAPAQAITIIERARQSTYEAEPSDPAAFQRRMQDVYEALTAWQEMQLAVRTVPLAYPIENPRQTSTFGRRQDPFLRRLAFHGGLDYGAPSGTPVLATANGTVSYVGWKGGYGKLVEVDHGNGVTTRYGHLSRFNVVEGQRVKKGQIIAAVGSTGRSTGPHLHYETRMGDRAVNPQKFLGAGALLKR